MQSAKRFARQDTAGQKQRERQDDLKLILTEKVDFFEAGLGSTTGNEQQQTTLENNVAVESSDDITDDEDADLAGCKICTPVIRTSKHIHYHLLISYIYSYT